MKKLILAIFLLFFSIHGTAQIVPTYEELIHKTDSARWEARDLLAAATFYEQALSLPEDQKPELLGEPYFNLACLYSMVKRTEQALYYLEKSFMISNDQIGRNPYSLSALTFDPALRFVRYEKRFHDLLKKYYPGAPLDVINSKEISYDQLLEIIKYFAAEPYHQRYIRIANRVVFWNKKSGKPILNRNTLPVPYFEGLRTKTLVFLNSSFELNFDWTPRSINEESRSSLNGIFFDKCLFKHDFSIFGVEFTEPPRFIRSTFSKDLFLNANLSPAEDNDLFTLDSCLLNRVDVIFQSKSPITIRVRRNMSLDSAHLYFHVDKVSYTEVANNKLDRNNLSLNIGNIDRLEIHSNKLNNILIEDSRIGSEFDFQNNKLSGKLFLKKTYFSNEPSNDVDWADIANSRIAILKSYNDRVRQFNSFEFISGENESDFSNDLKFSELLGLYSMLLNTYKNKGDLESYNKCFIVVKEIQSRRLKYLYESHKTFETFFRWKLSQLLKFYVRHGTDPARAIVISLYIVFWFGIFFFFFPSDWDVTSKKRLVRNFKDFIQKNEKGYLIPFFVLIGGFALSLVNALTLSLNAFITLGFGNIPTHGLARYVCVIEGFIGWFLLSIFTVALINQVL